MSLLEVFAEQPTASIPQATKTAAQTQGAYRFLSNPNVTPEQIIESHREAVIKRGQECKSVLVVQDTTEVSYTSHRKVRGLGFINQSKQRGIKLHSCLAVSGEGEPLGLLHQEGWSRKQRKGKKEQRKKLPIAQKESYRWLTTLSAAEAGWEESAHLVHIGDREADIFELFAHRRRKNSDLLIRAQQNRKIEHELGYLMVAGAQGPVLGRVEIELQRNPKRKARRAQLCCRAMGVRLEVPQQHPKSAGLEPIELNVIWVEEEGQPEDGTKPIRWVLLTTLPIEKFEQVWQCVQRSPVRKFCMKKNGSCWGGNLRQGAGRSRRNYSKQ